MEMRKTPGSRGSPNKSSTSECVLSHLRAWARTWCNRCWRAGGRTWGARMPRRHWIVCATLVSWSALPVVCHVNRVAAWWRAGAPFSCMLPHPHMRIPPVQIGSQRWQSLGSPLMGMSACRYRVGYICRRPRTRHNIVEGFKRQVVTSAGHADADVCKMCDSGRSFAACCKKAHLARESNALRKGGHRAKDAFTMYCFEPATEAHKVVFERQLRGQGDIRYGVFLCTCRRGTRATPTRAAAHAGVRAVRPLVHPVGRRREVVCVCVCVCVCVHVCVVE